MKNYIILYKGPATPGEEMSEEQSKEVMESWGKWIDKMGISLLDVGEPMENGTAIVDDGSEDDATDLNGYSIIQAESMEDAKSMLKDHPFLSEGEGRFSIEIHELVPMPEME